LNRRLTQNFELALCAHVIGFITGAAFRPSVAMRGTTSTAEEGIRESMWKPSKKQKEWKIVQSAFFTRPTGVPRRLSSNPSLMAEATQKGCQTVAGGRSHGETSGIGSRIEMHPGGSGRSLKRQKGTGKLSENGQGGEIGTHVQKTGKSLKKPENQLFSLFRFCRVDARKCTKKQ